MIDAFCHLTERLLKDKANKHFVSGMWTS